jgi:hypothetical protein
MPSSARPRPPPGSRPSDEELRALLHDYLFLKRGSELQQIAFDDALFLLRDSPEGCWRLIEFAAISNLSIDQLAFFAAGPLEDLLGQCGEDFIERLETAAEQEPDMRKLVACVWRGRMTEPIWQRVLDLRERLAIQPL